MLSIIFTIYSGGSENFQCGNLRLYKYVAVKKCGGKSSAFFYRLDSSFPYPAAPTFILRYLFTLYYTFQ
ncbi:hypothetical protein COC69_01490 [Bacillus cereus]|uniref:Uncharacterized protein n=1 Tax=Bacillus cereus TaxID=1396 RepID=A0A9X7CSH2_BACCE|nr:hypothetical protein CN448_18455 [Bacillus cereus]PFR85472.1 hypothetical protein COK42_06985 [Bacillus cereus]PGS83936.1 hypothetical protein COC69_01490 [Bacillus cereus]PGT15102.1 hypothetical protein COD03_08315 [Bacillus cereus]